MDTVNSLRISAGQMQTEFERILKKMGFSSDKATKCAAIFVLNSLEGVSSHGINRFPRFIKNIKDGHVLPLAEPALIHKAGSIEQWNGNLGPGPLNATFATARSMELAEEYNIGMVALSNTNHWMRAGTYGREAASRGFVFIGWTNTCPNMPAWGAKDPRIGNNPLVIAIPYKSDGIVLDFAMSQFSYGKIETYHSEKRSLPYPGGFNRKGELTADTGEILESWRILPAGYWKGSGLSVVLDILAAILSGGLSTHEVKSCTSEKSVSQVYIAVSLLKLSNFPSIENTIENVIKDLRRSVPENENAEIRYPGENVAKIREDNLRNGVQVNSLIWEKILSL